MSQEQQYIPQQQQSTPGTTFIRKQWLKMKRTLVATAALVLISSSSRATEMSFGCSNHLNNSDGDGVMIHADIGDGDSLQKLQAIHTINGQSYDRTKQYHIFKLDRDSTSPPSYYWSGTLNSDSHVTMIGHLWKNGNAWMYDEHQHFTDNRPEKLATPPIMCEDVRELVNRILAPVVEDIAKLTPDEIAGRLKESASPSAQAQNHFTPQIPQRLNENSTRQVTGPKPPPGTPNQFIPCPPGSPWGVPCINPEYQKQQRELVQQRQQQQEQANQQRLHAEMEQLRNPSMTLGPDDQKAYFEKYATYLTHYKEFLDANVDAAHNRSNLTAMQIDTLGKNLDNYAATSLMWSDNTQINNWQCQVLNVNPGGQNVTLPGRPLLLVHNGGSISCYFFPDPLDYYAQILKDSSNEQVANMAPVVKLFSNTIKNIIFEDGAPLANISKRDTVQFNARVFCPKWLARDSMAPDAPPPDAWKTCAWGNLTFIGQKVIGKTE